MKTVLVACGLILLTSCTIYTEKQTEALSRAVYATKDSLTHGRIDLADQYSEQAVRIVKPPKQPIKIEPIFETLHTDPEKNFSKPSSLTLETPPSSLIEKRRVLIVPEKFKNDPVVAIGTLDYEKLLLDQKNLHQLQKDYENLSVVKKQVDQELIKQNQYHNQMVKDLNQMQKQLVEKDLAILKRNVIIGILGIVMALGVYLRIKGVL